MSDTGTKHMLAAYEQSAPPERFLSSLFKTTPDSFYTTESVEIDIERGDEDISIAIQDLSDGGRGNSADIYTNKEFVPPIHDEEGAINSFDLLKRDAGQNPFANQDFQLKATIKAMKLGTKMSNKILRSMELQSSQVLTTGIVTLTDSNGVEIYGIDYKPKATHFPTAGTAWSSGGATIADDIRALVNVIRDDGLQRPDQVFMGEGSFEAAITNTAFKARFETRRMDIGTISPMKINSDGGEFRGVLEIGNYKLDIWTYGGRFKDPQTGDKTKYLLDAKVIVRASGGRLQKSFGAIPNFIQPEARVLHFLPDRVSSESGGRDFFTNSWVTANGKQLFTSVAARPLMIPVAIDTFGCISTGV